jgi:nucleotide-binding universal stress UspA family protein
MRTVLVPLDGSLLAEQALPHACRLALAMGARLLLVRAALPVADPDAGVTSRSSVQHAEAYLNSVRERLVGEGHSVYVSSLHSDPVPGILLAARVNDVTLIVMSTHGRTGLRRMVLGSVTEQLVQESQVPVLVVNTETTGVVPDEHYRRILVPLDGSASAENALSVLRQTQIGKHAKVVLLRAVPPTVPQFAPGMTEYSIQARLDSDQRRMEAAQYLDLVGTKHLQGHTHQAQVVVEYPAKAILDAIGGHDIDLIVMATGTKRGADHFAPTSVAGHVLHNTSTPVLIVQGSSTAVPASPSAARARDSSSYDDCLFGMDRRA